MKNEKKHICSKESLSNKVLSDTITMMDARIAHMEDTILDYRDILVKLVKQGNRVTKVLKELQIDLEHITSEEYSYDINEAHLIIDKEIESSKFKNIKELINEYMEKHQDLKEFEKELKKHKDDITPGQVGES